MAKPTPLPLGRPTQHVLQSRGADPYIMNFYSTSYSTTFSKPNIENNKGRFKDIPAYSGESVFKPRSAPLENKTGFTTNVRPQIYYNRNLDEFDNPEMGRMLADNYETITYKDYHGYALNTGLEELPAKVSDLNSAYTQKAYNHNPRPAEVAEVYLDTKIRAPYDVLPKHKALLDKINDHNPLSNENHGHGPFYMSTETGTKFIEGKKEEKMNPSVGPKEISGFVSNKEVEDVLTGVPGERWLFRDRPTDISETHLKFQNYPFARSETQLPNISNIDKTRDSTYVKTFKSSHINPKGGSFDGPSEYKDKYLGVRDPEPRMGQKLGTAVFGDKEVGGQARNELGSVQTLDDPRRFVTNYKMKHYDMTPVGKDREGFVSGGVNSILADGYTKNNKIHSNADLLNPSATLKSMDAYQSRSIRANDRFYADTKHDHKYTLSNKTVTFQENNPYSVNTSSF